MRWDIAASAAIFGNSMRFSFILLLSMMIFTASARADQISPRGDVAGKLTTYNIVADEDLYDIAHHFDIGVNEIRYANPGVNPWKPKATRAILIPSLYVLPQKRQGIVINLPELRLYYYHPNGDVYTFPVAVGREGWNTPVTTTKIVKKRKDPIWIPTDSIRAEDPTLPDFVPAGPKNPLGKYALNLGIPGFALHGTLAPRTIGTRASHGCLRMYPKDIEALFNLVEVGTPVAIVDEPYKLGWRGRELFAELPPGKRNAAERKAAIAAITRLVVKFAGTQVTVDADALAQAVTASDGIPVAIGKRGLFASTASKVTSLFHE
ncbi:MAG: L,D-transpeptidase family protein [Alphaproteobacteria bacterium]|nr:L,D-transpeptidase family protein [Alphaproteobacteria bacterium]